MSIEVLNFLNAGHCLRFAEASCCKLPAPELQNAVVLDTDETLAAWLSGHEIAGGA